MDLISKISCEHHIVEVATVIVEYTYSRDVVFAKDIWRYTWDKVSNGLDIKNKLWTSHGGSSDSNCFIIIHIDTMRQKNLQWSVKPLSQKRVIASMELLHGIRHNENLIQQYRNIKMHGKVKLNWEAKICNNSI